MILINSSTRQFNIPGADLVFGVESDSGSEIKEFQSPRYVGNNVDLAGSFLRINYRNANGEIDSYLVKDVTVEGENVLFSWELTPKVTMYKGQVKFVVCVVGPDTKVKWHTTLGTGQVLEGLEPDEAIIEEGTADVVAQLIAMVEAQTEAVEAEGTKQIKAVQTAAKTAEEASVAQIEAKGVNVRESIPDDYSALSEAVDGLNRGRAGAIVCEVEGSAVVVNDASDNYLQGLRIFGRSTQDGTPTPGAPVEIKSVEKPVVTVCGKNLLNADLMINEQFVKNADGTYTITKNGTSNLRFSRRASCSIPKGNYTLSVVNATGLDDMVRLALTFASGKEMSCTTTPTNPKHLIVDEEIVKFAAYLPSDRDDGVYTTFAGLMLECGSEVTTYEPYKPVQTVELTHTLPGIPVTSGGNYTDSEGQQWICDEVDFERGVYVRRCTIETLTFSYQEELDRYRASLSKAANSNYLIGNGIPLLCDKYVYAENAGAGTPKINGIRIAATAPTNVIAYHNGEAIDTATILYPLATPIETPLSETEIAAWRELHSNYPNTTVMNDGGAHMVVKYAADTKKYIDNKFAALGG